VFLEQGFNSSSHQSFTVIASDAVSILQLVVTQAPFPVVVTILLVIIVKTTETPTTIIVLLRAILLLVYLVKTTETSPSINVLLRAPWNFK
jgi:hypothetical protein